MMNYYIIFDGNCNLCVNWVQVLENFDKGEIFQYTPMQNETILSRFGITAKDCQMGVILIDADAPERRWQGSDAAEEVARLLPIGNQVVEFYRALPGVKWIGDRFYEKIRDNRYNLFGKRDTTYQSAYPFGCNSTENCSPP